MVRDVIMMIRIILFRVLVRMGIKCLVVVLEVGDGGGRNRIGVWGVEFGEEVCLLKIILCLV